MKAKKLQAVLLMSPMIIILLASVLAEPIVELGLVNILKIIGIFVFVIVCTVITTIVFVKGMDVWYEAQ